MTSAVHESEGRLLSRIECMSSITSPGPGVTRPGFGTLEREAHHQFAEWGAEDRAEVETDEAGNTTLVFRPGEPYFLLGSHLDSVPHGGKYDGVAGVLAAMEAARRTRDDIDLGLRVVAFSAEEGATFGRPCLGSELATGQIAAHDLESLRDAEGCTALERASSVGLHPADCRPWISPEVVAAFLELHIEQGGVLETENVRIGVVDAISGAARLLVSVHGQAGHSGTTPMRLRADALAAAAELMLAIEEAARSSHSAVSTVGRIDVTPNSVTTIPSDVEAVIDVRALDPIHQKQVVDRIRDAAHDVATNRGVEIDLHQLSWRDPVVMAAWPKQALKQACADLTMPFRVMPSGAGHDSAGIATRVPTGMLFVPTPGSLSHVPEEACRVEDLEVGVEILARAVRVLDENVRCASTSQPKSA